jgi:hypothetical protein
LGLKAHFLGVIQVECTAFDFLSATLAYIPVSLPIMAPEILGMSPPTDKKLVKEVVTKSLTSLDASSTTLTRSGLVPLFRDNTFAKLIGVAEAYLEDNVCSTLRLVFGAI